jgi:uncharacterized protein with PIN domain
MSIVEPPKFLCDDNLGKLARYLRTVGCDTFFEKTLDDARLLSTMLKENRLVLTRDRKLVKRLPQGRFLLIETDSPEEQLKSVLKNFDIKPDREAFFSRCLECNEPCVEISRDEIEEKVFPYILKKHESFTKCPACGRIFWPGSHYKDMVRKLDSILS